MTIAGIRSQRNGCSAYAATTPQNTWNEGRQTVAPNKAELEIAPSRNVRIASPQRNCAWFGAKFHATHGPTAGRYTMQGSARTKANAFAKRKRSAAMRLPSSAGRKIAQSTIG